MVNNKMPYLDYVCIDWYDKIKHICGNFLANESAEAYKWATVSFTKNGFHVPLLAIIDRERNLFDAIIKNWINTIIEICIQHIYTNI